MIKAKTERTSSVWASILSGQFHRNLDPSSRQLPGRYPHKPLLETEPGDQLWEPEHI